MVAPIAALFNYMLMFQNYQRFGNILNKVSDKYVNMDTSSSNKYHKNDFLPFIFWLTFIYSTAIVILLIGKRWHENGFCKLRKRVKSDKKFEDIVSRAEQDRIER